MRSKVVAAIGKFVIMGGMALAVVSSMPESALQAEAATKAQLKEFRSELKSMILSADSSVHDVEKYNMTYQESYSVWKDLANSDCKFACNTGMIYENVSRNASGKIKTYQIVNLDKDFLNRYNSLCKSVDEVVAGIDEDMNDVEKVLYIHEYLMENVYFKKEDTTSYTAGGPLGYGYGVCQGYSQAMRLLLSEVGIQSELVSSVDMNHAWLYVNLDGEWYHTDVLWDDVEKVEGAQRHIFLLKNDDEFQNVNGYKHYNWYIANSDELSDSTRFSNWFVHDVQGLMRYYNGFWYFQQGNCIMKSKIDGTEMSQVVRETSKVVLNALEDGVLYYTVDGMTQVFDLEDETEDDFAQVGSGIEWSIEDIDWTEISYWQLGHYKPSNGAYGYYKGRICLKHTVNVSVNAYDIHVEEENYRVLIRELNKDGVMVKSNNLADGDVFEPTVDTAYVGIGLYNTANDSVSYSEYKELLAAGAISITPVAVEETPKVDNETAEHVDLIGDMNIDKWQDGYYDYIDASYKSFKGRICMKEFVAVDEQIYEISVSDSAYHVLIRELDAEQKFIATKDLKDGDVFTPEQGTAYIAINLYNETTRDITFEQYGALMKNGFEASIIPMVNADCIEGTGLLGQMDMDEWQYGHYDWIDASYTGFKGRICKKEYVQVVGGSKIKTSVSETGYRILIRELDSNKKLLRTDNLVNGDIVTLQSNTAYLAISIYNENDNSITFEQYGTLFTNGFTAELNIL